MLQHIKWICVLPVLLLYVALHGQMSIRTNQILASARHDMSVGLNQKHLDFIGQTNQNIPFVDQISLRTETDRFMVYRQEYLARLTVNGPSEIRRQRFLNKAELQTEQIFQRRLEHEALVARYEAVSAYRFIQQRTGIQQELKLVYEDKVNVFHKLAALNAGTEVDELLKAEYDLDELNLEIDQAIEESEQLQKLIAGWLSLQAGEWALDTTAFIQPPGMQLVIDQLPMVSSLNPLILEKQSKIEELQAEYYFEKASASQMLDFFQLRYANRPDEILAREFSAGLGINLPFKGSSRVKLAEIQIDKNNEEQFLLVEMNQLNQEIQSAQDQMKALGGRYRIAEDQWKESQNKYSLEHPSLLQADGPMILLKAREYQIKRQLKLADLEKAITDQYVKILDLTGALSSVPLINYFSDHLENY